MEVTGIPGEVFTGKVTYIYPYLEEKTRTNRVRLEFDNSDLRLKPEMFANVTVRTSLRKEAVVVPSEAIVRSGTREQVFVVRGPGKFEPRTVTVGVSASGLTQILSGVTPGEEVVTSSQFLIDSDSKLREATAKMTETSSAAAAGPPPLPTQIPGIGTIKKVMREEHKLNIEHEPIEELDWPTMIMDFDVVQDVRLDDVNAGDRVHFTLNPDASNHYVITDIHAME
jgi:Cu/Ag efflux protein CusF